MKSQSQLNQSNAMFTYDGDYSYLHKEESATLTENVSESSLMWLKINGYEQSKNHSKKSSGRKDLMWLKISGYKQKNAVIPFEKKVAMYATEPFHETVYQQMQLTKAKCKFYFEAMSMLAILNAVVFLTFFHH